VFNDPLIVAILGWGGAAPGGAAPGGAAPGGAAPGGAAPGAAGGASSGFNWAGGLGIFIWPAEAAMVEGK
jgi:hypothetical protein